VVVKWHVQVGADEDALVFGAALSAQIGEANDVHGVCLMGWFLAILCKQGRTA
jgi:hypothetical protein